MRRILLALLLIPALSAAEIPVVPTAPGTELVRPDGSGFGSVKSIVMDGEQIAVLAERAFILPHRDYVFIFEHQGDGSWREVADVQLPWEEIGPIQDFAFQGNVIVYTRRATNQSIPGVNNLTWVTQSIGAGWHSYTTNSLIAASGPVAVQGDTIAISRIRAVAVYRRLAGQWALEATLPESGNSSIGSNARGPAFALDSNRVLIGSNDSPGSTGYFLKSATLYQRLADGSWAPTDSLLTPLAFYEIFAVAPVPVTLSGNDAAVQGVLFHRTPLAGPVGGWDRVANLSPVTSSLDDSPVTRILPGGVALVSGTDSDLYRMDFDQAWQPLQRFAAAPRATDGRFAVSCQDANPSAASQQFRCFASTLDTASTSRTASISDLDVSPAAALPGDMVTLTAATWVGRSPGRTVQKVEFRVASGSWQAMAAADGAFNEPFEIATARVTVPAASQPELFLCVRVTDSAGQVTQMINRDREPCPIVEVLPLTPRIGDDQPPLVSEVKFFGTAQLSRSGGESKSIYAFADDSSSGELCIGQADCAPTNIQALQFRVDSGVWQSMKPRPGSVSGNFHFQDEEYEAAQGPLPRDSEPGTHTVCVRGIDTAGNLSAPQCVNYEVVP
jgi:hypothetical protein